MSGDASAPPRRAAGTRTRAGNAMARTRSAVLDGAERAVEKQGARRVTMTDIATVSGVAKATLYNHFRTRDAVLTALVETVLRRLGEEGRALAADDLAAALATVAERIGSSGAVRASVADDPATAVVLTRLGDGPLWTLARQETESVLRAAGLDPQPAAVATVLRWLASHVSAPGAGDVAAQAAVLAAGLAPVAGAAR